MESPTVSPDGRSLEFWLSLHRASAFGYRAVVVLESFAQLVRKLTTASCSNDALSSSSCIWREQSPTHIAANTHRPVWPPTSCIQVATQLMRSLSSSAPICALVDSVLRRQSSAQQFTHGRDLTANESVCGLALLSVLHAIRAATDASVSRTITLYARI